MSTSAISVTRFTGMYLTCFHTDAIYYNTHISHNPPTYLLLAGEQLNVYFNGYRRIMFKDALLKLYASCDRKLAEVRGD